MSEPVKFTTYKYAPFRDEDVPGCIIEITKPDVESDCHNKSMAGALKLFDDQAEIICQCLKNSLPSGVFDRLAVLLLQDYAKRTAYIYKSEWDAANKEVEERQHAPDCIAKEL
jgi:hypothetical protein